MLRFLALLSLVALAGRTPEGGWPIPPQEARVIKVYDGDTFTLEGGDRVRLRWVNTPELRPAEAFGEEAKQLAVDLVHGRLVKLDVSPEERDGYGRIIAGVKADGRDLSMALLEAGLAHVFMIPPDPVDLTAMLRAQAKARKAGTGIWSTENYKGDLHMTSFHANASGPDEQNVNGEYIRVVNITDKPVSLKGYTITNVARQTFKLPALTIPAGHTVQLRAGIGPDQEDPAYQLEAHLQSPVPIWNNDGDIATLIAPNGKVVDSRYHKLERR